MITAKQIAREWLSGEDLYQWRRGDDGKFPIEDDVARLYHGPEAGGWDVMFANCWSGFAAFRDGGQPALAYQKLGKLAATARAFEVTVNVAAAPELPHEAFDAANRGSWLTLLTEGNGHRPNNEWRQADFSSTQAGALIDALHLPLEPDQPLEPKLFEAADELKLVTFDMLVGYTETINPQLVPRPGVPSGEILPWIELRFIPTADHS
ncbi:MAG: hypothetical protein KIH63_002830 [Candidatus Saccharibacteria bacterium]|nr:hypothetical protein [Candidatus Saccharibacteria bacterium]